MANTYDAVVGGELVRGINAKLIYVADETERDALENISPGFFVATYGVTVIWQYKGDGAWAVVKDRRGA